MAAPFNPNDVANMTPMSNATSFLDVKAPAQSDTVDEADFAFRAIRVTVAGNVKITTLTGRAVVCAFLAGETRYIAGTRVWSSGTTATGIEIMR